MMRHAPPHTSMCGATSLAVLLILFLNLFVLGRILGSITTRHRVLSCFSNELRFPPPQDEGHAKQGAERAASTQTGDTSNSHRGHTFPPSHSWTSRVIPGLAILHQQMTHHMPI